MDQLTGSRSMSTGDAVVAQLVGPAEQEIPEEADALLASTRQWVKVAAGMAAMVGLEMLILGARALLRHFSENLAAGEAIGYRLSGLVQILFSALPFGLAVLLAIYSFRLRDYGSNTNFLMLLRAQRWHQRLLMACAVAIWGWALLLVLRFVVILLLSESTWAALSNSMTWKVIGGSLLALVLLGAGVALVRADPLARWN